MEITASRNLKNFSSEFGLLFDSLTLKTSFYPSVSLPVEKRCKHNLKTHIKAEVDGTGLVSQGSTPAYISTLRKVEREQ